MPLQTKWQFTRPLVRTLDYPGGGDLFQPEGPQVIEEFSKSAAPCYLSGIVGVLQGLLVCLFHKSCKMELQVAGGKLCGGLTRFR